ncbi:DUF1707 SHOCT-like domain-containing protein [Nocardioides sp.]|uniref:DUF1707 SHOCT-like domain-containing protein n=1 Tax=Nocardioides sp. TaxID=35761 RepID=UPI0039E3624B
MNPADLRVGDEERDRAAASLGEHYSAGRLTQTEYAERLDAIWTARTRRDLDDVFHDLPKVVPVSARPARRRWLGWPYSALLFLIVAGLLITHPKWLLVAFVVLVVVKIARHQRRHSRLRR